MAKANRIQFTDGHIAYNPTYSPQDTMTTYPANATSAKKTTTSNSQNDSITAVPVGQAVVKQALNNQFDSSLNPGFKERIYKILNGERPDTQLKQYVPNIAMQRQTQDLNGGQQLQNPNELIKRAISMSSDQMKERDVLYPLPIKNGRWGSGNIYHRPFVHNGDGTTSTMVSQVFSDGDGHHVIMNVTPDGQILSGDEAQKRYYEVGDNGVATFDSLDDALNFDAALHPREVQRLKYQNDPNALAQYEYDLARADHPDWFDRNGAYIGSRS